MERKTLYTVIVRLPGKKADLLADAAIRNMTQLKSKVKTIAFNNCLKFAWPVRISTGLGVDIYFAYPYASLERGINENTNGLISQYFPKKTSFNEVTHDEVQHVMDRPNSLPRTTRDGRSPNESFMGWREDLLAA